MFTSRSEYRLSLRADNADRRLTKRGIAAGMVSSTRAAQYREKCAGLEAALARLQAWKVTARELSEAGVQVQGDGSRRPALAFLEDPTITIGELAKMAPDLAAIPAAIAEQLENDARYRGYLQRQEADIRAYRRDSGLALAADLDYTRIAGLSTEIRSKLTQSRPASLAAAGQIAGMTPAALTALLAHVRRQEAPRAAAATTEAAAGECFT